MIMSFDKIIEKISKAQDNLYTARQRVVRYHMKMIKDNYPKNYNVRYVELYDHNFVICIYGVPKEKLAEVKEEVQKKVNELEKDFSGVQTTIHTSDCSPREWKNYLKTGEFSETDKEIK